MHGAATETAMPQLPVLNNQPRPGDLDNRRGDLLSELRGLIGPEGEVRFGRHDRMLYATDASLYQVEPIGVVVPGSIDEAERVVRWAATRPDGPVAILPRGGGTSLAGQCTNRAIVLDFTPRCRGILAVDESAARCVVEPGIGVDELNEQLLARGFRLFFAPDPATTRQAAVGGCIGNNAAGARSIRYGRTSENIERLEVCLGTGERLWLGPGAGRESATAKRLGEGVLAIVREHAGAIRQRFPRTVRRNAGYGLDMILDQAEAGATAETVDLAKLLCGSEGTLAVTLAAELKLQPVPRSKGLMVVSFRTLEDAIAAVQPILELGRGMGLTAVELLDDVVLDAARGNIQYREYVDLLPGADAALREPKAALYIEFFGFAGGITEVESAFAAMRHLCAPSGTVGGVLPGGIATYTDTAAMLKAWALRKAGEPLLHGLPGKRKPVTFVEDNAVPVERLGEFVREFKTIVGRHGTRAAYWAHASVGVLHVRPMIDLHDPADRQRLRDIAVEVADLARACGGIMSGEHGDGRVRGPLLERFFGPDLMRAFREVKALFDPAGILNPGNIVAPGPIESITANLRVDAAQAAPPEAASVATEPVVIETFFDYAESDGFGHAVEQCNGAGVCRKRGGVMCPSYHATLDERHSTRGRGNALRLAITGQFDGAPGLAGHRPGGPKWDDVETIRTLDLCLSCKGCKSECPSNVDISKLKAEYTAQRFRKTGRTPLAVRATGHVRSLNQIGSITPGLANWVNSTRPVGRIIRRVMGIHPSRGLPKFSRSLYRAFRSQAPAGSQRVVLFADCFTTYNESHIGLAAARVLEAFGYRVELVEHGCCGRSMISTGMLPAAIRTIDRTIASLRPAIEDPGVRAILFIEPSCLSAIKDDWLSLKCRTSLDLRRQLASKAALVEEFLDARWDMHPAKIELSAPDGPPVLLHAHCHQKSLWGVQTSARLIQRVAGDRLRVLDTGCCGMAGSFGYGAERYALSMRVGELTLFPAIRSAPDDAIVIAPGTSCRHQVHEGVHRAAIHPIELVAKAMGL